MKKQSASQQSNHITYQRVRKKTFEVDGTRMVVEDRIYRFRPERSERILRIAGSSIYYSVVPLSPTSHRLLCYNYCEDVLRARDPGFYRNALVMGCGGGALPRWLLEEYPDLKVDVVDRSPEMIDVSKNYFLTAWDGNPRLTYTCVDAKDYLPPEYSYQFIFCDLFGGTELAPIVYSRPFAAKLRGMLADDGTLAINCGWHHLDEVKQVYQEFFKEVQVVERPVWQTEVVTASGRKEW